MSSGDKERKEDQNCKPAKCGKQSKQSKPRFTALLLAVRSELLRDCRVSPEIESEVRLASGGKGMLQRSLSVNGAILVVLGTSYSSKDKERDLQMTKVKSHGIASTAAFALTEMHEHSEQTAVTLQRSWRGHHDRSRVARVQSALDKVTDMKLKPGTSSSRQPHTYVCLGDQNMRMYAQDGWSRQEPGGASSLTPEAVEKVVELMRSQRGRAELLGWSSCGSCAGLSKFYSMARWWRDGGGAIGVPTYKRTPYFQTFPALAQSGEFGKPQVITTEELLKYIRDLGDESMVQKAVTLADAEARNFIGAAPSLLKHEFFGMRDTVPVSKVTSDAAQTFLKEDARGNNVYMQCGWLDTLSFGQGLFTSFESQEFRSFEVVPELHGFDHLLTVGVLDFKPGTPRYTRASRLEAALLRT